MGNTVLELVSDWFQSSFRVFPGKPLQIFLLAQQQQQQEEEEEEE